MNSKRMRIRTERFPRLVWAKLVLSCLLVGGLLSCSSGKLDSETAAIKLNAYLSANENLMWAHVGRVGSHCSNYGPGSDGRIALNLNPATDINAIMAAAAGYVTINPDGKDFWRVTLTDKGRSALSVQQEGPFVARNTLNGCDFQIGAFALAKPALVKITRITAGDPVQVEYQWEWAPTALGASLRQDGSVYAVLTPQQRDQLQQEIVRFKMRLPIPVPPAADTQHSTASFKKYDDGWRIVR